MDNEEKELTGFPSIDKPWMKYYSDEAINSPLPECTIYEYMYENNKDYPHDIAIVYFNRKINYAELFENIDKTAKAFTAFGVKKGDIVTVAMPSMPEALYCVYAINRLGAVANMIHPLASENEICNYLNEVNSTVFVLFTGTYELIKHALNKTSVKTAVVVSPADSLPALVRFLYKLKTKEAKFGADSVFQSWNAFITAGDGITASYQSCNANEIAIISHTGGTTGEPKGCLITNANCNAIIQQVGHVLPNTRQEKMLVPLPPFVNYSLVNGMLEPLALGLQTILIPDYKADEFDVYIRKYHPNHINSIPLYCEAMLGNKKLRGMDLSCLKHYVYGGEGMTSETEKEINSLLLECGAQYPLGKGLGSTELTSSATFTTPSCNFETSVGIPFPRNNAKITEPGTTDELEFNTIGEICITGPSVMVGYYNRQKETDDIIIVHPDGNRWLHTGDLGYINEDGVVFVTGRIKRIIMTKGNDGQVTKMFPDRIEKAVLEHPAVSLCCVIGIEDKKRIHYPKAIIVLNSGYEKSDSLTEEILAACKEKLPDYMVPVIIEYRDNLPRTNRGKIDYRALEQETEINVKNI